MKSCTCHSACCYFRHPWSTPTAVSLFPLKSSKHTIQLFLPTVLSTQIISQNTEKEQMSDERHVPLWDWRNHDDKFYGGLVLNMTWKMRVWRETDSVEIKYLTMAVRLPIVLLLTALVFITVSRGNIYILKAFKKVRAFNWNENEIHKWFAW